MGYALNGSLHNAKIQKNDEFYTQFTDIEKEMIYYKEYFLNKTVYLNCDDPVKSQFWRYFHINFEELGLSKLISTHCSGGARSYRFDYTGGNDGDISSGIKTDLMGNGDFKSKECKDILTEADIVVTNPPFSLFRAYMSQLMEYNMSFLIIGSKNVMTYKDFFSLLKNKKVWPGHETVSKFVTPAGKLASLGNVGWFTNIGEPVKYEKLILNSVFLQKEYPLYENYEAFSVNRLSRIPSDTEIDAVIHKDRLAGFKRTYGDDVTVQGNIHGDFFSVHIVRPLWGVPVTFIEKQNAEQFEIINADFEVAEPVMLSHGKRGTGRFYVMENGQLKRLYSRITIRSVL